MGAGQHPSAPAVLKAILQLLMTAEGCEAYEDRAMTDVFRLESSSFSLEDLKLWGEAGNSDSTIPPL